MNSDTTQYYISIDVIEPNATVRTIPILRIFDTVEEAKNYCSQLLMPATKVHRTLIDDDPTISVRMKVIREGDGHLFHEEYGKLLR